jgi:predicted RNA polymerase sigma factor
VPVSRDAPRESSGRRHSPPDRGVGGSALERYQPLHAAHAELLNRAGDAAGAARAYEQGIALTASAVERAELERRLGALR